MTDSVKPSYIDGLDESANFLSRFSYSYFGKLLQTGSKKILEPSDLPALGTRNTAAYRSTLFSEIWQTEVLKNPQQPSIVKALYRSVRFEFRKACFFGFVGYESAVASPLLLQLLIKWINNSALSLNPSLWQGYVLAVGLFLLQILQTLFVNRTFEAGMRIGTWLRTSLISAVFEKSLRLSTNARQLFPAGKIMNIMANDISRIDFMMMLFHLLWVGPLQLVTTFILLYWLTGVSSLVGLGVICLCLPFQYWASRKLTESRKGANLISDQRIKITQEVLLGIKVIKLYAWETSFFHHLEQLRRAELKHIRWIHAIRALAVGVLQTVPIFACIANLIVYQAMGNVLTQDVAFTCLAFYYVLRVPLLVYPTAIAFLVDSLVACTRIKNLLLAEELSNEPLRILSNESDPDSAIEIKNASFEWSFSQPTESQSSLSGVNKGQSKVFTGLRGINMDVKRGKFVAIVGKVGSGKSSLLNAIIGEMNQTAGDCVRIAGSLAYCAQNAWIQNLTLKDNILFGKQYNEAKYEETLKACALLSDLKTLAAGDETEIGEKGINLSGGQKQRVNIARAVYANTDIILMDDSLSAVDAHVGTHLLEECLLGVLKEKTRVLVTHRLHILPSTDYIYVLDNGEIIESGSYIELMESNGVLTKLMEDIEMNESEASKPASTKKAVTESKTSSQDSVKDAKKSKLIIKEGRDVGQVTGKIYVAYIIMCGGWGLFTIAMITMAFAQGSRIANDFWLNIWIQESIPAWVEQWKYQIVYFALGIVQALFNVAIGLIVVFACVRASRAIHGQALGKLLNCPMSWFDSQPLGRVINRFSRDLDNVDTMLIESVRVFLYTFSMTLSIFIMIAVIFPLFLLPLIPVLYVYYLTQSYYRKTSIELKRLDNVTRSPISALFSEVLTGSGQATIRAYHAMDRFYGRNRRALDDNNQAYYLSTIIQRWLSLRLESLASILVLIVSLFGVIFAKTLNPGAVGLSLTYALQVTFIFNWCIKQFAEMEMHMNSVERLKSYIDTLPDENDPIASVNTKVVESGVSDGIVLESLKTVPEDSWPQSGNIEIENVVMRYREDLDDVLKGISFSIKAGEKVGIVGRTGAGKSSLISALFLLTPLRSGKLLIDGKNIAMMPLTSLRKKISIIPQDPVIFSGTLRDNLDPFKTCTDDQVWKCLEHVGLKQVVDSKLGLSMAVSEGGENWSTGQRQLICLARAMLRNSKILLLDEATASVDMNTDKRIQESLRSSFVGCTIITIAHRLETIMDYDKIVVLEFGKVKELGSPSELIAKKGVFFSMAKEQDAIKE